MSRAGQVAPIWSRAIQQYESITKKKLDDPAMAGVTTVDSMLQMIENQNSSFSSFRAKGEKLRTALKYAMRPVELVGDLAASGAAMAFPPSSLIFAGVNYLIKAAHGVSEKYDAIIEIMSMLKDFTIRLEAYSQQRISSRLSTKLADILATLLEVLAFARQEIKRGRLLSYGKNIFLGNDGASAAVAKLDKLFQSESALVGAETLAQVKGTNVTLDQVQDDVAKIKTLLQNEPRKNQVMDTIKQILQPSNYAEDRFTTINRSRVPDTGNWIRREKGFEVWEKGERPILWVCGTPGAGKSYIASNIISHLRDLYPQRVRHPSQVSIGCFFYKDDDAKTRSVSQSLRDVAFQIALNDPLYAQHLASTYDSLNKSSPLPSLWRELFLDYFMEMDNVNSKVYIVLDALDEAFPDDRLELFDLLQDIQTGGRIQLLMLGRPHVGDEMINLVELHRVPTVYVSGAKNFHDIVHYIQASITKSLRLRQLPKSLQSEIVGTLSTRSQGMFIWVGFMLQELQRVRDRGGIRKALDAAPKGLSRMIQHVLKGFSELLKDMPEYAEDFNELLAWVVSATHPLKLAEVESILKWRNPDGEGWIRLEGDLRGQFGSIFVLTREDRMTTAEILALSHEECLDEHEKSDVYHDWDDPDEGNSDFDSDPNTTDVSFNHASLGDYFRDEKNEKISAGEGFPFIGVDYPEAAALVLLRYLEVIVDCGSPKNDIALALRPLACRSLVSTLGIVDPEKITGDRKRAIGQHIVRILSDESVFPNFVGAAVVDFYQQHVVDILIKWLSDPVVQGSLSSREQKWYEQTTAVYTANILQPVTRYLAIQWLQGITWVGVICCWCIWKFLEFQSETPTSDLETLEGVLEAAEWAGLEKTAVWHRNVGEALRGYDLHDKALEYYQKALDRDPNLWLARSGMTKVCLAQNDISRAIEFDMTTVKQLEAMEQSEDILKSLHTIYERLGVLYWNVYDSKASAAMWEKAYECHPRCADCISARLDGFREDEDFEGCLAFWKELDKPLLDKAMTRLVEFLLEMSKMGNMSTHGVIPAIQQDGSASFFIEAYSAAVVAARREHKAEAAANLELCLGYLYAMHGNEPGKAIHIWERLLDTYHGKSLSDSFMATLESVSDELGSLYLGQYLQASTSDEEKRRYGILLERLARKQPLKPSGLQGIPREQETPFVTESRAGFNLGHFYKICGRDEAAQQCYKAQTASCVRLLSDNDPTNDRLAFYRLGCVLGLMGDKANAIAAFYQCEAPANQDNEYFRPDQGWHCDECGARGSIDGMTFCCFCPDVAFCDDCVALLRSGRLSSKVCSPKHEVIYLPPRDADVRKRSEEHRSMLYVDGNWVTLDDFKNQLKEKYEL